MLLNNRAAEPPRSPWVAARTAYHILADARGRLAANDAGVVETQMALSEIAAPTGREVERGAWVARRFTELGLEAVRTDSAGNVIGCRPGSRGGPSIAVCAHLDTVFPSGTPLHVRRDGDRLLCPGIGDNGRGLAAMLALAEAIDGRSIQTRSGIEFVATTGEEGIGDLAGAKAYFAEAQSRVGSAIALDGAGDERIVHQALGSRRYRVTLRGPGGHSWAAHGIPNPIHAAGTAISALGAMPVPSEPRTTVTVTRVGGGIAINAIPEEGWFEVDLRSASPDVLERYDGEVRQTVRHAVRTENARRAAGTPPLEHRVDLVGDRPCGAIPPDHPLVVAAIEATRLIGRTPALATASTDANIPLARGIPAIALGGGGRGGEAHTAAEWYENADGPLGLARALTTVVAAAGIG